MKFANLVIENFGPFTQAAINLKDRGLLLIQGQNEISTSSDSNGSGKSFVLESIIWALYGRTIRGLSADKVVNNKIGKNCRIELTIEDGADIVKIERGRKHSALKNGVRIYKNGADITPGTVKDADQRITEIVGSDFETFVRSVYFDGHNVASLPTMTDKEVKAIIERALGVDLFDRALDAVRQRKSAANLAVMDAGYEVKNLRASKELIEKHIAADEVQANDWRNERNRRIGHLQSELEVAERQLQAGPSQQDTTALGQVLLRIADALANLPEEVAVDTAKATREVVRAEANVRLHEGKMADIEAVVGKEALVKDAAFMVAYSASEAARKELNAFSGAQDGTCHACGQVISNEEHRKAHRAKLESRISDAGRTMRQRARDIGEERVSLKRLLEEAIAKARNDLAAAQKAFEQEQEEAERQRRTAEVRLKLTQEAVKREQQLAAIRLANQAAATAQSRVDHLRQQLADTQKEACPFDLPIKDRMKQLHDIACDLGLKRIDEEEAKAKLETTEQLEKLYGPKGLRVNVIEAATPLLNERANHYARAIADGELEVRFETFSTNAKGERVEKFAVAVTNVNGSDGYIGLSSGERRKIDLSIALAFSDLVGARSQCAIDFWCADEIAESLDPTAVRRVVDVLKEIAQRRGTAMVISHTPLDDLIDNGLVVRKMASGSKLEQMATW